jgi:flagellar assembly factor FliW
MLIDTSRFGQVEIDPERIIEFADGVLGFPEHRRFALIQTAPDAVFFWLQSIDDAGLAFVVCDPLAFVADYRVPIRSEELRGLDITDPEESQVLVIVNKVDGALTANLLGPLLIGARSLRGKQLVLSDRRYTTRHEIMSLPALSAVVSRTA